MSSLPRTTLMMKLMGAFLLVTLTGALVVYFFTSQATQNAFRLYSTQSGQLWAERLAPAYAEYYQRGGSWAGVAEFVQSEETSLPGMMHEGGGMGRGRGMGGMNAGMLGGMGQRLILADLDGAVVVDTAGELTGSRLTSAELESGAAVLAEGRQVGTLIVAPANIEAVGNPEGAFLETVNRSILLAVLVAGGISLLLALLLSLQISAPVRRLQKAAGAISRGELSQRVPEGSTDELGDLARAFNGMAGSLAESEAQRRKMLADIAHELRTPTAVIQANAEGMQDGVLPLDMAQVNAIHAETLLLSRLIDDLRLISLAEAGELRLERAETDLAHLLRLAVERFAPQCQQKRVELALQAPPGLPHLRLDGDRITQVVNNLVANALRHTPPGGTITVQAEVVAEGVAVSVTDTGTGIAPADLPRIFDRFYRVDKSRARASGGSGLGLAIVRQLVEAHGGKVEAASPVFEGYGTRIRFVLPR